MPLPQEKRKNRLQEVYRNQGPTAEHRENALKHLAMWCIAAQSFDRQWKHSGYNPANLDGWPPLEVLLQHPSFAELRPATTVATDVELERIQQGGDRPENSVPAAPAPDVPDAALPAATAPDAVASSGGSSSNETSNGSSSNTSNNGSSDSDS